MAEPIRDPDRRLLAFGSDTETYADTFVRDFLAHTDQKRRANDWLDRHVEDLPHRRLLIDVGAGNGAILRRLAARFDGVLAVEPNPVLADALRAEFPAARVVAATLDDAGLPENAASLALLIHVLYYLPRAGWPAALARLAATLRPGGHLVAMVQRPDSDFHRMLADLAGLRPSTDLRRAATEAARRTGDAVSFASEEDGDAWVASDDLEVMVNVAAFAANALIEAAPGRGPALPTRGDVARWIVEHGTTGAGYRLSCAQEIAVLIRA